MATGVPRTVQPDRSRFAYRRAGDCGGCPANSGADHATSARGNYSAGACGDRSTGAYRATAHGNRCSAYTYGNRSATAHGDRHSAYTYGDCRSTYAYGDSDSGASRGCRQLGRRAGS